MLISLSLKEKLIILENTNFVIKRMVTSNYHINGIQYLQAVEQDKYNTWVSLLQKCFTYTADCLVKHTDDLNTGDSTSGELILRYAA